MSRYKKEQLIYTLEMQRKEEVRSVMARFNDRRNRFDGSENRNGDRSKRNYW